MPEESSPQEGILKEAQAALQGGDKTHARDLLTRLIRADANNPSAWIWMSISVETSKEKIYCLNEALRIEPENALARRGLVALGAMSPDPAYIIPFQAQKRDWEKEIYGQQQRAEREAGTSALRLALTLILSLAALVGLVVGVVFLFNRFLVAPAAQFFPTPTFGFISTNTPAPQPTSALTTTPEFSGPQPLWMRLSATYTPTPIYAATPHPLLEDYRSGLRQYQRGEWDQAAKFFLNAIGADQKSPDLWYLVGDVDRFQGNNKGAVSDYNMAITISANFAPAYLGRARANLALNASQASIQADLEKAISLDPNMNEAYLELAALQLTRKDANGALKTLEASARLNLSSPLLFFYRARAELALGRLDLALLDAQAANRADITYLPAYRLVAEILRASGNIQDSLPYLETFTLYQTGDKEAWTWLAKAYLVAGRQQDALKALDKALALDNKYFDAHFLRGQIYLDIGDGKQAALEMQVASQLNPNSFAAMLGKGLASVLNKDYMIADTYFAAAINLAKNDTEKGNGYYYRGLNYEALGQNSLAAVYWNLLAKLPSSANLPGEWLDTARQHLQSTSTPVPSATPSITPTRTLTATRTPAPSLTPTP